MIGIRTVLLTLFGLGLILLALVDVGYPSACEHAKGLAEDGRLADARKEYLEILEDRPASDCATVGLASTTSEQCEAAKLLADAGRTTEAEKAYLAIATTEPAGQPATCARAALTGLPDTCDAADAQAERGLLTNAHKSYVALLTKKATAKCAAQGLERVTRARCAAALALANAGYDKAARKAYKVIATTEPVPMTAACTESPQPNPEAE